MNINYKKLLIIPLLLFLTSCYTNKEYLELKKIYEIQLTNLENENEKLKNEVEQLKTDNRFYEKPAAVLYFNIGFLIDETPNVYHNYMCEYIDDNEKNYKMYTMDELKKKGYSQCSLCFHEIDIHFLKEKYMLEN